MGLFKALERALEDAMDTSTSRAYRHLTPEYAVRCQDTAARHVRRYGW